MQNEHLVISLKQTIFGTRTNVRETNVRVDKRQSGQRQSDNVREGQTSEKTNIRVGQTSEKFVFLSNSDVLFKLKKYPF